MWWIHIHGSRTAHVRKCVCVCVCAGICICRCTLPPHSTTQHTHTSCYTFLSMFIRFVSCFFCGFLPVLLVQQAASTAATIALLHYNISYRSYILFLIFKLPFILNIFWFRPIFNFNGTFCIHKHTHTHVCVYNIISPSFCFSNVYRFCFFAAVFPIANGFVFWVFFVTSHINMDQYVLFFNYSSLCMFVCLFVCVCACVFVLI